MTYYKGLIDKYRKYLPVNEFTPIVTLNEGNTPLIKADNLAKKLELDAEIYLKFEGSNPTGSFKDRGMTMAVTKAKEEGSNAIICASTGNTSASAAAYGAKAGLKTYVLIPDGYIALGKLSQAMMYGAEIIAIQGNFDQALEVVRKISEEYPITLVNSVNPYRIEGQKTGAFEICDALGQAPDYHFIPVGNAGNITAYWKGYKEYHQNGIINNLPKMMGFEAEGAAAIVRGERRSEEHPPLSLPFFQRHPMHPPRHHRVLTVHALQHEVLALNPRLTLVPGQAQPQHLRRVFQDAPVPAHRQPLPRSFQKDLCRTRTLRTRFSSDPLLPPHRFPPPLHAYARFAANRKEPPSLFEEERLSPIYHLIAFSCP